MTGLAPGDWAYVADGSGGGLSLAVGSDGGVWAVTGDSANPQYTYLTSVNTTPRPGGPADILYDPDRNPFGGVIGGVGTVPGVPTRPVAPPPAVPANPGVPPFAIPLPGGGRWEIVPGPQGSVEGRFIEPGGGTGNVIRVYPDGSVEIIPKNGNPIRFPPPGGVPPG